jgi:putative endonuclease
MGIFNIYILYSVSGEKTYVGYTNDIERRIWEHNNHPQKSFTSRYRPWSVIYTEEFDSKKEAMTREKWFKSGVGREYKQIILAKYLKEM